MSIWIQDAGVLALVLAALIFLVRRLSGRPRKPASDRVQLGSRLERGLRKSRDSGRLGQ